MPVEREYHPNPKNAAIYNKLFQDYKNVYHSLEKAYRQANSARFEGTDQE